MQPVKKAVKNKKQSNLKQDALKLFGHIQFHGANRLADKEASWYWIPSMILLLICSIALFHMVITRYQENPTILMQMDSVHGVLPFPSVIVCPQINFRTSKRRAFLSSLKFPEGLNESYIWEILPQLAAFFSPDVLYEVEDLVNLELLLKHNNIDMEMAGIQLTDTCEETLIRCRFKNNDEICSSLFRMELTRDGFCCVFNGRSLRRELRENTVIKKYAQTHYTPRFGFTSGLILAINQTQKHLNVDLSYKWIALQAGQHFVDTSINGTALNPDTEQWIAYYIHAFHIADSARGLSANLRKCNMASDSLKYFPFYRKKYCVLECEMARTIKLCNCVRLVHPRPPGVRYCSARKLPCAMHVNVNSDICQCPPTCNVDTNILRITTYNLDSRIPSIDNFYTGLDYNKITVVRAFIQQREKKTKQRWSYYTYVDLFSQLGGMFNVFFGCSVLTLMGLMQLFLKITKALLFRLLKKLPAKEKMVPKEEDVKKVT